MLFRSVSQSRYPSPARDESGRWSGAGGMAPDKGTPSGGSSGSGSSKGKIDKYASDLIERHNKQKGAEKLNAGDFKIDSNGDSKLNNRGQAKVIVSRAIIDPIGYMTSGEAKTLKSIGVKLTGYEKSKDRGYGDGDSPSGYEWSKPNFDAVKNYIKSN